MVDEDLTYIVCEYAKTAVSLFQQKENKQAIKKIKL